MTSPSNRLANERRARGATQTRKRASRRRRQVERERLLKLGADPQWVERVLGDG
jgi:hypothetical protein